MFKRFFQRSALSAALILSVTACGVASANDPNVIRKAFEAKFPGAEIKHVGKSPIEGLYEVFIDGQMLYSDAKANYVVVGSMFDVKSNENLTEARTNKLIGLNWNALPLDKAIKVVKGNGARKVAVFADADCPYCKRLEQTFAEMNDITIYTFLYPIDELHPDAGRKSKVIWCSADRSKAWLDYMLRNQLVAGDGNCDNPVAQTIELAKKFRIRGTPAIILADGRLIPGAVPRDRLEAELAKSGGVKAADATPKEAASAPKEAAPAPKEAAPAPKEATK